MDWKYDAANQLQVVKVWLNDSHKYAIENIKEDKAIEMRDLCQDMIHQIEMFLLQHKL